MISLVFLVLGMALGWWLRGTRAGAWLSRSFGKAPIELKL